MARPRKDVMKAKEIDHSQNPKPEGGMAHSEVVKGDLWGGKKPPYPRSELYKTAHSNRSGMALVRS